EALGLSSDMLSSIFRCDGQWLTSLARRLGKVMTRTLALLPLSLQRFNKPPAAPASACKLTRI
ncbi:MAG: hypothetical protein ACR2RA_03470, partial [Geminicoccaceae bacterium]